METNKEKLVIRHKKGFISYAPIIPKINERKKMYNKKQLNKIKTLTQTLKQEQTKYHTKNEKIRQTIRDWVDLYNPHYFLTIRLAANKETNNFIKAKDEFKKIMHFFEKRLLKRSWHKHHLPFIAFAELKKTWHFHILLNTKTYTQEELEDIFLKNNMSAYEFDISPIKNLKAVYIYCTKQLHLDSATMMIMDTKRIITSYDLFDLPYKADTNTKKSHIKKDNKEIKKLFIQTWLKKAMKPFIKICHKLFKRSHKRQILPTVSIPIQERNTIPK